MKTPGKTKSVLAVAIAFAAVLSTPASASAATVNYGGTTAVNDWRVSGTKSIIGGFAAIVAYEAQVSLRHDPWAPVTSFDSVQITHQRTNLSARCGWFGPPAGTTFPITCKYTT